MSLDLEGKIGAEFIPQQHDGETGWRLVLRRSEDLVIVLTLLGMMVLPLAEILLRKVFHTGISGTSAFLQHFTPIIGLLGGAIAAREHRLLALSTLTTFLKGRPKTFARIFSSSFAVAVTAFLCVASTKVMLAEREGGNLIAYGFRVWFFQTVMPLGFTLITWRLLKGSSERWTGRLMTLALAGVFVGVALHPPIDPARLVWPGLGLLMAATVLGSPIFVTLGGAALILFWAEDQPIAAVSLTHYTMVTNPSLPTIPLFTLAGYFLAEGGASRRLIRVFHALASHIRGGPAIVTVLVCVFFTSFTGASGVTILALGGLLMPVMASRQHHACHKRTERR